MAVARSLLKGRKNEEPSTNYIYAPLNSHRNETRILKIRPSLRLKDPIVCSLRVVSLDDVPRPKYAALSYCWGKGAADQPICCDGSTIWVTADLLDALRSLRKLSKTCLWIDQISINQEDLEERSSQVQLMQRIYPGAVKTYLHLGCRDEFSRMIGSYVMCHRVCRQIESQLQVLADFLPHLPCLRLPLQRVGKYLKGGDHGNKLYVFVFRPCFARVWILQEVSLSTEVEVICHNITIRWDHFIKIVDGERRRIFSERNLPDHSSHWGYSATFNLIVEDVKAQERNTFISLLYLSHSSRALMASDPRDHLYTLLSLSLDAQDFPQPDYSVAVADVYQSFALALIGQGYGPDVLALASHHASNRRYPSWVPDWENRSVSFILQERSSFSAGRSGGHFAPVSDASVLSTYGIVVDTILETFPFNTEGEFDHLEMFEMLLKLVSSTATAIQNDSEYAMSQFSWLSLTDLHLTLILHLVFHHDSNIFYTDDVDKKSLYELLLLEVPLFARNSTQEVGDGTLAEVLSYHVSIAFNENGFSIYDCLSDFSMAGKFAITATGRLCLTVSDVQAGDKIGIILGCKAPYVLRKDGDGSFVIGEAYIQGLMHGEALDDTEHTVQEILIQ